MLKRIMTGALAGAIATVPQSAAVWGLKEAGLYDRPAGPEQVSASLTSRALKENAAAQPWFAPAMLTQHIGFGAAGGAIYALLSTVVRPNALTGLIAGLAIWKISYDGWIPALKIMPPPTEDERGRQIALLAAHAAYGLTLGALLGRLSSEP